MENAKLFMFVLIVFIGVASLTLLFISGKLKDGKMNIPLLICVGVMILVNLCDVIEFYYDYILADYWENRGLFNTIENSMYSILLFCWLNFQGTVVESPRLKKANRFVGAYLVVYIVFWISVLLIKNLQGAHIILQIQTVLDIVYAAIVLVTFVLYLLHMVKQKNYMLIFFIAMGTFMIASEYSYNMFMYAWNDNWTGAAYGYSTLDDLLIVMWLITNLATFYLVYQMEFKPIAVIQKTGSSHVEYDIDTVSREFALTAREQELLKLICMGKSNEEIGAELYISENTVKGHISHIFKKMNVKSRWEAVNMVRDMSKS